jgi:hypothetical protein
MGVVDDADDRSLLRDVGEQTQDRQADDEPIRRVAGTQTERDGKRVALRAGKIVQAIQERQAQLLQTRIREFHLRLDAGRSDNAAPGRVFDQILQQRSLADPRLPADREHPAWARAHARHQLIERAALAAPA